MNEEVKNWYSSAVLAIHRRNAEWHGPQPVPGVQLALCNIPRQALRPLFIQRQRVDRLWAELCEFAQAAHERAFCLSTHAIWIEEVLDLLETAPNDWTRFRYEAERLLEKDDLARLFTHEREDIKELARRLRNYSRGLRCLGEVEARRKP